MSPTEEEVIEHVQDSYQFNRYTYNHLIQFSAKVDRNRAALQLYRWMCLNNITPNKKSYQNLLRASIHLNDCISLNTLLYQIGLENIKLGQVNCHALLDLSIEQGRHTIALLIFGRMFMERIHLNDSTYNNLFALCIQEDDLFNAWSIFDQMIQGKIKIDFDIYKRLISKMTIISDAQLHEILMTKSLSRTTTSKYTNLSTVWTALCVLCARVSSINNQPKCSLNL